MKKTPHEMTLLEYCKYVEEEMKTWEPWKQEFLQTPKNQKR